MTTSELDTLLSTADSWAAADPDPQTAEELRALVGSVRTRNASAAVSEQELRDRFSGPLAFGTAGLRAALGAGPNRMNRVVVRRAAAGVAAHALNLAAGAYTPRAVVGFDARHNSRIFAEETAAIFTAAGIETFLMPRELPTPVLAYAIRALECEVGIMVTASHNPPQDNGYKVYLGGRAVEEDARGVQIVAPHDAGIAARIDAVGAIGTVGLAPAGWTVLPESIEADYIASVSALADPAITARDLRIVLTPLHGVGGRTAQAVLAAAGFADVTVVERQADPDPDFPTVAFPNPEEPGALDLALETAAQVDADLVIANDPDADRVALAAREPSTGAWRMLRGDEVGTLLGLHLAARLTADARDGVPRDGAAGHPARRSVFANSIVSSRLLGRIAGLSGIDHAQTLTGFKWIARVHDLSFGYEEALGYCVAPALVRDKDGISAGLLLAELAAATKAAGRTLFDLLDDAFLVHGLHASDQLSVRVASLGLLGAMMNRLRENPPSSFAGSPVSVAEDLAQGSAHLPPTDGLLYLTHDETRVIIRPSGTEPKLKCYLEVVEPVGSTAELEDAKTAARTRLDAVKRDVGEALGL
ncbi:phospho-sugar mutase [Arthrobacter sedimenti]|uniref:phospho-sugar mutase n=1 Tax=Arthrobacter sedimenti TaxID=2694931 RepID=UPI000B35F9AD|nr:phospho-sugar mutase [Arthrobacter sedimenti]OUM45315.1 phosphomannomutase [Arthrobacter agilis]